ncbi:MAG: pyridoxamine 5'-phosphate oxidase family protein [Acidimicrobiales bacterium]
MIDEVHSEVRTDLSRDACIDLLTQTSFARVVISVRCLPAALPVRIAVLDDTHLMVASSEAAVIVAARNGDVLSVQIDGLEPDGATWSVMASGLASTAQDLTNLPEALHDAAKRGATLISLPMSVLVGERLG